MSHRSPGQVDRHLSGLFPGRLYANIFQLGNIVSLLRLSSKESIVSLGQTSYLHVYTLDRSGSGGNPTPLENFA